MTQQALLQLSLGDNGSVVTDDTTPVVGKFGGIVVANDAVFTALNAPRIVNSAGLLTITLPAGYAILGQINGYTLGSGVVQAYNREEPIA